MHGKYYVDSQRIIFIRYEMPTVLRMRVFLACKLSFRLLCQNRCTVRREQMPLTALIRHLYFDEPCSYSDKHWKDCFYNKKKTPHFRTVVFRSERKSTANQRNIIVATLLNPSFTIAWNIYGRNRIKNIYFTKIIQISDKANLDLIHSED